MFKHYFLIFVENLYILNSEAKKIIKNEKFFHTFLGLFHYF